MIDSWHESIDDIVILAFGLSSLLLFVVAAAAVVGVVVVVVVHSGTIHSGGGRRRRRGRGCCCWCCCSCRCCCSVVVVAIAVVIQVGKCHNIFRCNSQYAQVGCFSPKKPFLTINTPPSNPGLHQWCLIHGPTCHLHSFIMDLRWDSHGFLGLISPKPIF